MAAGHGQLVMDFSQIQTMTEADIIANFGRMGANVDELFRRVAETIMPVIDRLAKTEAEQEEQKKQFEASVKTMTGLEERLGKSVNSTLR